MAKSYQELIAWSKAMVLVTEVYRASAGFPKEEMYGLTSQLRRAAVSVPSNIAEGQGRKTKGEFRHFLGQARGSLLEMETQLQIASNLGFLHKTTANNLIDLSEEVGRLLNGLLSSL